MFQRVFFVFGVFLSIHLIRTDTAIIQRTLLVTAFRVDVREGTIHGFAFLY